jgi:radical S-adenosyl methionine domain-containing protein 2
VNFAGGEPLLNEHLGNYIKYAKSDLGMKTSIITNASKMTQSWIWANAPYLDQVGISCDSIDEATNVSLGRGYCRHVEITERAFKRLRQVIKEMSPKLSLKLNTVVTSKNHHEDWTDFIRRNGVQRWKGFKVLRIEGENDKAIGDLEVSDEHFETFKMRHAAVKEIVPEDNDDMTNSYLMITPDGRFYQDICVCVCVCVSFRKVLLSIKHSFFLSFTFFSNLS